RPGRLLLEGADVRDVDAVAVAVLAAREPGPALVGGRRARVVAPVNGRAAGQQRHRLRRPAVTGERAELRVDGAVGRARDVAADAAGEVDPAAGAVPDQV